ncbi:golgin subfamily A member 2 [Drosophila hydei]|uniref:Golgin subfamily A member 2 n=1 Tax=Drosophila hydei TaxID=7224 RepID=A0A6J1LQL8_DROHY|nr:golgin subfamily A member 2 [Drosophila hydei]
MPDDTQDAKAQKLAAARKKLKEYQQRNNNNIEENIGTNTNSSAVSIASNLSERSDCELSSSNGVSSGAPQSQQTLDQTIAAPSAAAYFSQQAMPTIEPEPETKSIWPLNGQDDTNLQAIQVLIAEKAQLNTELTKSRHLCRERELELEELRTEHGQTMERLEQIQQHCQEQQRSTGQQRNQNAELQHKLAVASAQIEDQQAHLSELEAQVQQLKTQQEELQQQHAEKCNELDMAQLRIRQLSDESNVNADNRVETLTQTQYMYEQQIRDLQQMVTQLTQDKEQAAIQYQNYVASLKERNVELTEESAELKERERQLVEHVSCLERDIQKNLALQAQYKEAAKKEEQPAPVQTETASSVELAALKEKIGDLEFERHEFQLKIKSQDDQLQLKESKLAELEQELVRLQTEQPDQVKLLATMESDKVAASRALSQNMDMKQQLDELQQRFVQLTNDKLELVNKLDAEEFANREIRLNYASMEQKLQTNEERFKFKDEEMIRLSHENVELQRTQLMLQQQLDRLRHYEAKVYHSHDLSEMSSAETDTAEGAVEVNEHDDHEHKHNEEHHHHHHEHKHDDDHHHHHEHKHNNDHHHHQEHSHGDHLSTCETPLLPTAEAVEKLQSRFTTLISKVADLTEEKQSLEHLVLQLQSETETIGEYIALYQTQRRMLKQREYEKATQMRLLKAEREQLREKIDALNKLVGSLGLAVDLPTETAADKIAASSEEQQQQLPSGDNVTENENSQQILHKIQDIITEIKVNTEQSPNASLTSTGQPGHAVDHLNCCLGKFEVV